MASPSVLENGIYGPDNQGITDNNLCLYNSTHNRISEETEYVRKIRATLEKIHFHLCKDEGNFYYNGEEDKNPGIFQQNGVGPIHKNSFEFRYRNILGKLEEKELELCEVHRQNADLQIKLEATREAGADALRTATQKLYKNYSKQSEERRKLHEDEKLRLQACTLKHELNFKESIKNLNAVAEKIQDKHERIVGLENLMQRMEEEKSILLEKKALLEKEISQRMSDPTNKNGCVDNMLQISTVQEQIDHLQQLMMSQHQFLRSLIQESEELKDRLKEQDGTIDDLQERIILLESQNKELKLGVENCSSDSTFKVSKSTSVNESMFRTNSPYSSILSLRYRNYMERR